jgi:uncharacterized membrane protein
MSMTDTTRKQALVRWVVTGTAVLIGVVYMVAGLLARDTETALFGFVLMVAVGVGFVLLARRSEIVAGLRDRRDERINSIDRSATLFAGLVLICSVLVMFVVEVARGQDGSPYAAMGAIAGVAYLAALVFLRFRR